MDFEYSPKVKDLQQRVSAFMEERVYPNEARFHEEITANRNAGNAWVPTKVVEELKAKARAAGLWNLWLPESEYGAGLTNLEYAPLCEIMGRSHIGPERGPRPAISPPDCNPPRPIPVRTPGRLYGLSARGDFVDSPVLETGDLKCQSYRDQK